LNPLYFADGVRYCREAEAKITAAQALSLNAATIKLIASAITGGAGSTFHKLVTDAMVAFFNSHSHAALNAPPTQQMSNAQLTSTMTAE
jgi:hypothetical protein